MRAVGAVALLIAIARPAYVQARDPAAVVHSLDAAGWRFDAVKDGLPPVEAVNDETLEVEDWREYAYDGGALRVYVSRSGGRVIAVLGDTTRTPYEKLKELGGSAQHSVETVGNHAVVVPVQPIDGKLFDELKARNWNRAELTKRLGPPSYQYHVHGLGQMFLEYVPQGLSFVDDDTAPGDYVWFYLWDWNVGLGDFQPSRGTNLAYADYGNHIHAPGRALATKLVADREEIAKSLSSGVSSPDGRLLVTKANVGGTYNTEQIVIAEKGRAERRYRVSWAGDFTWLDDQTVLYRTQDPLGEMYLYALDAATGRKERVAHVPERHVPRVGSVPFRVLGERRFSYRTADGKEHEVTVPAHGADGFSGLSR